MEHQKGGYTVCILYYFQLKCLKQKNIKVTQDSAVWGALHTTKQFVLSTDSTVGNLSGITIWFVHCT